MEIEFHNAATGDPDAFNSMIDWCEKSQSKAILGGTLTSQADGASSTNALGNVHNEVRRELLVGDAKQVAKTISRDLLYPIGVLNGLVSDWSRCPRLRFDLNEPEDMEVLATALPAFISMGMKVSRQWAQERAGIPEPADDEDILEAPKPATVPAPATTPTPAAPVAALNKMQQPESMADSLDNRLQPITGEWIEQIRALVNRVESLDQLRDELATLLPNMQLNDYADMMAEALRVASLTGRADIIAEASNAN
jgi:phage gp29-like protein